ncbi:hypothetical protein DL93DRAFT_441587 [Clavulina sp. PMI_390]|nr:hypothetical protein DL93DRAFT_441587 [Clavulina sp. PMI_390]
MAPNVVDFCDKPYHWECNGEAGQTEKNHKEPAEITLLAMPWGDFSQHVWVALEYLEIPYQYRAICLQDPPDELFAVSPKGLVPAFRMNHFSPHRGLNESTVMIEYINDLSATKGNKKSLLPPVEYPWSRALIRLQMDMLTRTIIPSFFRYIQCQDPNTQISLRKELLDGVEKLLKLFDRTEKERELDAPKVGLWQEGGSLSMADILTVSTLLRGNVVLKHYRNFSWSPLFAANPRFEAYMDRALSHPAFRATCSTDELYLESFERYAWNLCRSQLAEALDRGRGIP